MPPPLSPENRLIDARANTHRVIIYCAGSRGLINFVRPLEIAAFKIGVTSSRSPQRRVEDLRRKGYAELWGRPDEPVEAMTHIEQGKEWFLSPWRAEDLQGTHLPAGMEIRTGHLEITFPLSVTVEAVDHAVHAMLEPRSLARFLQTEEGRARLECIGMDPDGQLLTRYTLMEVKDRISAAKEIYLFRPQRELPAFIEALRVNLSPLMARGSTPAVTEGLRS